MALADAVTMNEDNEYNPLRGQDALADQYTDKLALNKPFKIKYIETIIVDKRADEEDDTNALVYNVHNKIKTWYFDENGDEIARPVYLYRRYLDKRADEIVAYDLFPTLVSASKSAGTITLVDPPTQVGSNYLYGVVTNEVIPSNKIFSFVVPNLALDTDSAVEVSISNIASDFVDGGSYQFITHRITNASPITTFRKNSSLSYPNGSAVATGNTIVVKYDSDRLFALYLSSNLVTPVASVTVPSTITGDVKIRIVYMSPDSTPTVTSFTIASPTGLILPSNAIDGVLYKVDSAADFTVGVTTVHNNDIIKLSSSGTVATIL